MLKQILSITLLGLRSIPERLGASLVIVVGLAGVVAVFTALLAMAAGFQSTLESAGRPDVAIVLRGGSQVELNSGISRDQGAVIKQAPGVLKAPDGRPLASAEMVVIAELVKAGEKTGSNITVRGVEPAAFALRPQLRIVEGRAFGAGLRELIVGQGVARQYDSARLGSTVRMRGSDWTVVGVFESGDAFESEIWGDLDRMLAALERKGRVRRLTAGAACGGCSKCSGASAELFEWVNA
jgi:putative ABC transport system permease protein